MARPKLKYEDFVGALPKMLYGDSIEGAQREKINAVKDQFRLVPEFNNDHAMLNTAQAYADMRAAKDELKKALSELEVKLVAITELMVDKFEANEHRRIYLDGGRLVSTYREPYAKIINKEEHRLWCIKQGLERSMTLPWSTTNSLMKKMLIAGDPTPDGVEIWAQPKVRLGSED